MVEGSEDYDRPNTPITDKNIIAKVVSLAGARCKWQNSPLQFSEITDTLFKDETRRLVGAQNSKLILN